MVSSPTCDDDDTVYDSVYSSEIDISRPDNIKECVETNINSKKENPVVNIDNPVKQPKEERGKSPFDPLNQPKEDKKDLIVMGKKELEDALEAYHEKKTKVKKINKEKEKADKEKARLEKKMEMDKIKEAKRATKKSERELEYAKLKSEIAEMLAVKERLQAEKEQALVNNVKVDLAAKHKADIAKLRYSLYGN